MQIANERLFTNIYFSNREILCEIYCSENRVLTWDKNLFSPEIEDLVYIMNPKTYNDYQIFIRKLEKECPLLVELK